MAERRRAEQRQRSPHHVIGRPAGARVREALGPGQRRPFERRPHVTGVEQPHGLRLGVGELSHRVTPRCRPALSCWGCGRRFIPGRGDCARERLATLLVGKCDGAPATVAPWLPAPLANRTLCPLARRGAAAPSFLGAELRRCLNPSAPARMPPRASHDAVRWPTRYVWVDTVRHVAAANA